VLSSVSVVLFHLLAESDKACEAFADAVLAVDSAVLAFDDAVFAAETAALAFEDAVLAVDSAVLALPAAVLAVERAVLALALAVLAVASAVLAFELAVLTVDNAVLAFAEAVVAAARAAVEFALASPDTSADSWPRYKVHCSDRFNCSAVNSEPSLNTSYTVASGVVRFMRTADPDAKAETNTTAVPAALKSHCAGRVSAVNVGV
jgi:hypothetical protein